MVLSCSDSRVPPELVFDQGLGDIYVVRQRPFLSPAFRLAIAQTCHCWKGLLGVCDPSVPVVC